MRTRVAVAAVLVSLGLAAVADAATISLYHATDTGPICGNITGVHTTDLAAGVTLSEECTIFGSLRGFAEAHGVVGPSGLELGAAYTILGDGHFDFLIGTATARFTDAVTVTGGTPGTLGYLSLDFAIDGRLSDHTRPRPFAVISTGSVSTEVRLSDGTNNVTLDVPVIFGQESDLTLQLDAGVFVGFDVQLTGAFSDFNNTAHLTGGRILDANKNLIPNGTVVSESGLAYVPTEVPEPGTLSLLGGALAVGAWRSRRRKLA